MKSKAMILSILLGLTAVGAVLVVVVALQSPDFQVTRSATIPAPAEVAFAQVNDLHRWEAWSPWARLDPDAKNSYEGPSAGVGAAFAWSGNSKVGAGRMTITESRPNELVRFQLDFEKPMRGRNTAEFTFNPEGSQTVVTWTMSGTKNFIAKAFGLVMNCDKMVGGQFEQGLAQMSSVAKAAAEEQHVAAQ
jgi:hypothetical protein